MGREMMMAKGRFLGRGRRDLSVCRTDPRVRSRAPRLGLTSWANNRNIYGRTQLKHSSYDHPRKTEAPLRGSEGSREPRLPNVNTHGSCLLAAQPQTSPLHLGSRTESHSGFSLAYLTPPYPCIVSTASPDTAFHRAWAGLINGLVQCVASPSHAKTKKCVSVISVHTCKG